MSGGLASRKTQPRIYKCNTHDRNKHWCLHNTVASDLLDEFVLNLVQDWVSSVDRRALRAAIRAEVKGQQKPARKRDEVAVLKQEIAAIRVQRDALMANCLKPGLSAGFLNDLSVMRDELAVQEEELQGRLAEMVAAFRKPLPRKTVKQRVDAILANLDSLAERLASTDLATRKAAIR